MWPPRDLSTAQLDQHRFHCFTALPGTRPAPRTPSGNPRPSRPPPRMSANNPPRTSGGDATRIDGVDAVLAVTRIASPPPSRSVVPLPHTAFIVGSQSLSLSVLERMAQAADVSVPSLAPQDLAVGEAVKHRLMTYEFLPDTAGDHACCPLEHSPTHRSRSIREPGQLGTLRSPLLKSCS